MDLYCCAIVSSYFDYIEFPDKEIRQMDPFIVTYWRNNSHIVRNGSRSTHVNGRLHSLDGYPSLRIKTDTTECWIWHFAGDVYEYKNWHISGELLYKAPHISLTTYYPNPDLLCNLESPLEAALYIYHGAAATGWVLCDYPKWWRRYSYALINNELIVKGSKSRLISIGQDVIRPYIPSTHPVYVPQYYTNGMNERLNTWILSKN
jgi:hypothetical protein